MSRKISPFLLVFMMLIQFKNYGQSSRSAAFIMEADSLYSTGYLQEAVTRYESALTDDPGNGKCLFNIAFIYHELKRYDEAIDYADKIIKSKNEFSEQAFLLKGDAFSAMDKLDIAVRVYEEGIRNYPHNYLFYHNEALVFSEHGNYDEAVNAALQAVKINPLFANNHYLIGMCNYNLDHKTKSMLALYHYLLLEPAAELSASALQTINELWGEGISDDGDNTISIFMNPPSKDEEFSGIEFMIPFMMAVLNSEMHADETASQIFASNNRTVFGMLSSEKKDKKNVWINYYAKFFLDLKNADHTEAFSYYIKRSDADEEVAAWLTANEQEVENMLSWLAGYHE